MIVEIWGKRVVIGKDADPRNIALFRAWFETVKNEKA